MKVINDLEHFPHSNKFVGVALGNFDGVHLGHQVIINKMVAEAKRYQGLSVVFSFDPHPMTVLKKKDGPHLLTNTEDKEWLVQRLNVDCFFKFPFSKDIARMSPEDFVENILIQGLNTRHVFVGFNYTFGKNAAGKAETLAEICAHHDCRVTVVPAVMNGEICISSTIIRRYLSEGKIREGNAMLGYPYSLSGKVVFGDQRGGRLIGFPTANVEVPPGLVVPGNGVYVVRVKCGEETFDGVANIGCRPTIGNNLRETVEVHILDQNLDLYGRNIRVFFLERLRNERKFIGLEELAIQIKDDIFIAKKMLNDNSSLKFQELL